MVPAVAVKVVETEPAGTVTELAGSESSALLLLTVTAAPPEGATFERLTMQMLETPVPRIVGEQAREERLTGATRLMEAVLDTPLSVAVMVAV
jgi:hypothetical protein